MAQSPALRNFFHRLWKKESNASDAMYVDLDAYKPFYLESYYNNSNTFGILKKNNYAAMAYFCKGSGLYIKQNWYEAIEQFNMCLCFAEPNSPHMYVSYASRAGCFFYLGMYSKCLVDIDLALCGNVNARELRARLDVQKMKCLAYIQAGMEFVPFKPKINFTPHPKFPCLANVIDIGKNNEFGRLIYATKDINVGQTVISEKAYISKIVTEKQLRCNTCYEFLTNLIPCQICTDDMFCNKYECRYNSYHNIECNMKTMTNIKVISNMHSQIIRSILMAIRTIPNIENLMKFVESVLDTDPLEIPKTQPNDDLSRYRTFLKLSINSHAESELFQCRVYFITRTMMQNPDIRAIFWKLKHRRFLMHLIGHHVSIFHYNTHASVQIIGTSHTTELLPLITSYFNHACGPNVVILHYDDLVNGIVVRPIKKGEQLCISYFAHDFHRGTIARRTHFMRSFNFFCRCPRCDITMEIMPQQTTYDVALFVEVVSEYAGKTVDIHNIKRLKYFRDRCYRYLRLHGRKVWTEEVSVILQCLLHVLSYQYRYKVTI